MDYTDVKRFQKLFAGRKDAFGTGAGSWVKRPLGLDDLCDHLQGKGPGVGVAPLLDDGTVTFAAIDLDEPDFEAAQNMREYIPGISWIEKSRSGNAHVWVFFEEPIPAWLPRGILKEAVLAAGKSNVEIFPKQDKLRPGMLGNYINLPYHGDTRKILSGEPGVPYWDLAEFVERAEEWRNDPKDWKKRADWLLIVEPSLREKTSEFGSQKELHMCAEYIIGHCDEHPITEGHRNAVFFALAKQLTNCEYIDHDEAWALIQQVNDASPDRAPEGELRRILGNAESGQYTSTDCDNPLVQPFCDPRCPIAHPPK